VVNEWVIDILGRGDGRKGKEHQEIERQARNSYSKEWGSFRHNILVQ
jgi:hypothetical protein